MTTHGEAFATALAAKDAEALTALLAPDVDFLGLTPRRFWEGTTAAEVLDVLLATWFEPKDEIRSMVSCSTGRVGPRESVTYRFDLRTPDGHHEAEQTAYLEAVDGRISYLRIMCSGFMKVPD